VRWLCETFGRWFQWDDTTHLKRFSQWALLRANLLGGENGCRRTNPCRNTENPQSHRVYLVSQSADNIHNPGRANPGARCALKFSLGRHRYRAKPYHGAMSVLLSEDLLDRGDHLDRAWRRLASKAAVFPLKGSHLECITAHVVTWLKQSAVACEELSHNLPHQSLQFST